MEDVISGGKLRGIVIVIIEGDMKCIADRLILWLNTLIGCDDV